MVMYTRSRASRARLVSHTHESVNVSHTTSWAAFPSEIRLLIFGYLDREEWKLVRSTSKANAELVTPKIFRTIHLTPNSRSFGRARAVAESPKTSVHVRHILYHIEALMIYKDLYAFQHDILSMSDGRGRKKPLTASVPWSHGRGLSSQHQRYLEELDGEKEFQVRDEEKELTELCQHFTTLQSVITIVDDDSCFYTARHHVTDRRGPPTGTVNDGLHFANLFGAVGANPLTSICALSMSWRDLAKISRHSLKRANLQHLERLYIILPNDDFLLSQQPPCDVRDLDALLSASVTSNDFTLELDFVRLPSRNPDARQRLRPIATTVFQHRWPKLKTLAFRGIYTVDSELQDFMAAHSTTLRSLNLGDVEIKRTCSIDLDFDSLTGSVMGFFQWIHEHLTLDAAAINGVFSNADDEGWFIPRHEDQTCIRRRIESWLTRTSPSPVPSQLRQAEDGYKLNKTAAAQWTDQSWNWFDPEGRVSDDA